jgi:hypothetical protein
LADAAVAQVVRGEQVAVAGAQGGQGRGEVPLRDRGVDLVGYGPAGQYCQAGGFGGVRSPGSVLVDGQVPGDRIQPGQRCAGAAGDLLGVAPGAQHRFLDDVFGAAVVAGQARSEAPQGAAVVGVERGEQLARVARG